MGSASIEVVERIERAEIEFLVATLDAVRRRSPVPGSFVADVADGVALFVDVGWPMNKVLGLGLAPAVDIDRAVDALGAVQLRAMKNGEGIPVELSDRAAPGFLEALVGAGYAHEADEVVLALDPRGIGGIPVDHVEITTVGPAHSETWIETSVEGFAVPAGGVAHADFPRAILRRVFEDRATVDGVQAMIAIVDGAPAGAASLRVHGGLAQFCGATTLPGFRGRGVQTAMLRARVVAAGGVGCTMATVTAPAGSISERNARSLGFTEVHRRRILTPPHR